MRRLWQWYSHQRAGVRAVTALIALLIVVGIVVGAVGRSSADNEQANAPTPEAGESAGAQEYRDATARLTGRYREALGTLATLTGDVQLADETWRMQYGAALDDLKVTNTEARGLQPPECFATVHNNLLAAATAYDRAVAQAQRGLETGEQQGFRLAAQTIAEADQYLTAVTDLAPNVQC